MCWHQGWHCHQPCGSCWEGRALSRSCGARLCQGSVSTAASLSLADPFPSSQQGCSLSGSSGPSMGAGAPQGRCREGRGGEAVAACTPACPLPQQQDGRQQPCQGRCSPVALPAMLGSAVPTTSPCWPHPHPSMDQAGAKITGVPALLAAHPSAPARCGQSRSSLPEAAPHQAGALAACTGLSPDTFQAGRHGTGHATTRQPRPPHRPPQLAPWSLPVCGAPPAAHGAGPQAPPLSWGEHSPGRSPNHCHPSWSRWLQRVNQVQMWRQGWAPACD